MAGEYVTDTGFQKKTLAEIKEDLEAQFKEIFGDDIDLDESGSFGQLIGILSKDFSELWDALEEIYTCRNVNQATGVCLDNIVAENAIARLDATATFVNNVLLEGDEGTIVQAGKKAKQQNNTLNYSLVNDVTITKTNAAKGVISVTDVISGNTYTVTIDSTNYDYVAQVSDTAQDILDELQLLIDAGSWTGSSVSADEQLTLTDLENSFSFDITGDLNIDETWSEGDFQADEAGSNTLPANSLIEIVTPVTGWDSVNNESAGATGRDTETDDELRIRRAQSIISGTATEEAIASSVFNNVEGVTAVNIFSNRTDSTDSESRPPHSFETVVEGGTDQEVGDEIWRVQPAGIQSFGNTSVTVQDSQGRDQQVDFSRPETVYIFLRVRRSLYVEESYPSNGDELIKENIVNWSLIKTNIDIGKDVILQRLATPVYGVDGTTYPRIPGIEDIEITADFSKTLPYTPTYVSGNISINDRELASFAIDRIEVDTL